MPRYATFLYYTITVIIFSLGIFFHRTYFGYRNSVVLGDIAKGALWFVELLWITVVVAMMFFKKFIYKHKKKIFLVLAAMIVMVIVLEFTLRLFDSKPRFIRHPYLNYQGTPNYKSSDGKNIHNSFGFRGPEIAVPKPKGVVRIAILGGSSVYEEAVADWRDDFARQLERALENDQIEVINAGILGYDSWDDLINLEFKVLDLEPDMIIVYEGVNDVHARLVTPDAYRGDNTGRKKPLGSCLSIFCSKVAQVIFKVDWIDDYSPDFEPSKVENLEKNTPKYLERNLRNTLAIAKEHKIKVLLASWAWSDQFNDFASTPHYLRAFRQQNALIDEIARSHEVAFYDFASEMPKDKRYWADGRHNNEEGVRFKAQLFANFIKEESLIE